MKKVLLAIAISMISNATWAGNFWCDGIPQYVMTWKDGRVGVKLETMNKRWLVCNKSQNAGCESVLANLLTAKSTKNPIRLVVLDNTYSSCDAIPDWATITTDFDYAVLL